MQAVAAKQLTKTFSGVRALDRVDFGCVSGEVHALVGENGAGKSTLVKILAGALKPDSGEVFIKERRVEQFNPQSAQAAGIGVIYQELSLLPYMRVAENVFLGREPKNKLGLLDYPAMESRAREILGALKGCPEPRALVSRLSPAQRQLVEIAKALSFASDVLIMDEPSSSLAEHELHQLFAAIRSLNERGVTILYISHRLEEIFEIADRVTVLKDGQVMGTRLVADIDRAALIRLMVGREVAVSAPPRQGIIGEVVLEVRGLTRAGLLEDINLILRRGEILGLAGLVGSGRTELARAIFGADPIDSGTVLLNGRAVALSSPRESIRKGIALMPEDRQTSGLALQLSLRENIALASLRLRQRLGFVRGAAERQMVLCSVKDLSIQTPSIEQPVLYLSGGNQQKVVLAKWLNTGPEVIIFDEPTRGIDVGTKMEVYAHIRKLAESGKAIIMISSELPEILQLSDRIIVLSGGQVAGELTAAEANEEAVLALAFQRTTKSMPAKPSTWPPAGPPMLVRWQQIQYNLSAALNEVEWRGQAVFVMLFLISLAGALGSDMFLTSANLTNLLRQVVMLTLLSIGETFVILSGGVDLSASSVVTMAMVFGAGFMAGQDRLVVPGVVLALAIGALVGLVNASIVVKLSVPAFIATLGMDTMGRGIVLLYTRVPITPIPPAFRFLAHGMIGALPASVLLVACVLAGTFILLYRTRYGRHLFAVGGDQEIARLSGIRVERVRAVAYLISGLLAATSGLYLCSRMSSGDPAVGPGLGFRAISAVLLGGTILGGGRGGLVGTIGGFLALVVLSNVFNQLAINVWYQQIVQGIIVILAVSIYRQRS